MCSWSIFFASCCARRSGESTALRSIRSLRLLFNKHFCGICDALLHTAVWASWSPEGTTASNRCTIATATLGDYPPKVSSSHGAAILAASSKSPALSACIKGSMVSDSMPDILLEHNDVYHVNDSGVRPGKWLNGMLRNVLERYATIKQSAA